MKMPPPFLIIMRRDSCRIRQAAGTASDKGAHRRPGSRDSGAKKSYGSRSLAACREIGIAQLETYYALFASRIAELRHAFLPSDWDGSFAMTEK
jgi:hypothetical protein